MARNAIVTGAGSGVGRATALLLAKNGWLVAIIGRRQTTLQETIRLAGVCSNLLLPFPCDITDRKSLEKTANQILDKFGNRVDVLVNSAGTNTPRRSLSSLSFEDYDKIINTNLTGAYNCIQAFLPSMRSNRSGTIVNIVSDAGKQASPKAGAAYVASKFGLAGLTQSINAEERNNGIRACAIFPGDIDTPLLDLRPEPPSPEARKKMLMPDDIARCVMFAIDLPEHAILEEMLIRPR
jgi:NADP-dependent 3-hydroxy acid dehydrogenase YdfG